MAGGLGHEIPYLCSAVNILCATTLEGSLRQTLQRLAGEFSSIKQSVKCTHTKVSALDSYPVPHLPL